MSVQTSWADLASSMRLAAANETDAFTKALLNDGAAQIVNLREERDESDKALHRLPMPPEEMGDGPDERALYALQLIKQRNDVEQRFEEQVRQNELKQKQIAQLMMELESYKTRVWQAEHDLERCRVELELWKRRANAQLEITRVAMAIVNAPFQILDSITRTRSYRISGKEFGDLETAVKQYMDAAKSEQEAKEDGTNPDEG